MLARCKAGLHSPTRKNARIPAVRPTAIAAEGLAAHSARRPVSRVGGDGRMGFQAEQKDAAIARRNLFHLNLAAHPITRERVA